jgi:hypothetical protein
MPAGELNLKIEKGADFSRTITWQDSAGDPVSLVNGTAYAQAREYYGAPTKIFDISSLGTAAQISLGGTAGTIAFSLTDTQTAAMTAKKGYWDLLVVLASGNRVRLMEGEIDITGGVSSP